MMNSISRTQFEEVSELVNAALDCATKDQAAKYIKRLEFLYNTGGYQGYVNTVFSSLVASVKNASGAVREKERKKEIAYRDLYKLEGQITCQSDGGNANE